LFLVLIFNLFIFIFIFILDEKFNKVLILYKKLLIWYIYSLLWVADDNEYNYCFFCSFNCNSSEHVLQKSFIKIIFLKNPYLGISIIQQTIILKNYSFFWVTADWCMKYFFFSCILKLFLLNKSLGKNICNK